MADWLKDIGDKVDQVDKAFPADKILDMTLVR